MLLYWLINLVSANHKPLQFVRRRCSQTTDIRGTIRAPGRAFDRRLENDVEPMTGLSPWLCYNTLTGSPKICIACSVSKYQSNLYWISNCRHSGGQLAEGSQQPSLLYLQRHNIGLLILIYCQESPASPFSLELSSLCPSI